MRATWPAAPEAWPAEAPQDEHVRVFTVRALTPIYKGGADPAGVDLDLPFRGPSIRGVLRVWWRATSELRDTDALRAAEQALFGGVFSIGKDSRPVASKLIVHVRESSSKPSARRPVGLDYALWVDKDGVGVRYHEDAQATLTIRGPRAQAQAIDRALRAWLLVGGIGSRSRRGLGAVWTDEAVLVPRFRNGEQWAQEVLSLAPARGRRPWSSLAGARVLALPHTHPTAVAAMSRALQDLHDTRGMQMEGGAFTGRHREPELQQDWARVRDGAGQIGAAPALGLPLAWRSSRGAHFSGARIASPTVGDRLPSPVLLKPVEIGPSQFLAGIVVLPLWATPEVKVSGTNIRGRVDPVGLDAVVRGLRKRGWALWEGP